METSVALSIVLIVVATLPENVSLLSSIFGACGLLI